MVTKDIKIDPSRPLVEQLKFVIDEAADDDREGILYTLIEQLEQLLHTEIRKNIVLNKQQANIGGE